VRSFSVSMRMKSKAMGSVLCFAGPLLCRAGAVLQP